MPLRSIACIFILVGMATPSFALSLAPEEFTASRAMACVLVQKELGLLGEQEYGAKTHSVLDGFDEGERDTILAKALGYFDGLLFAVADSRSTDNETSAAVAQRLEAFAGSASCTGAAVNNSINI